MSIPFKKHLLLVGLLGISILSCHKEDSTLVAPTQTFSFGYSRVVPESGKTRSTAVPSKIRVSILSSDGESFFSDEVLNLLPFGGSYVSETIELPIGEYELTQFMVLDESDAVVMACPIEGSEKSGEVEYPLPISFDVAEGKTNSIRPEVLWVGNLETPDQFGYIEFGFELVNNFSLEVSVISDYDGSYVPSYLLLRSFSNDSSLIDQKIYPYQSGHETIGLLNVTAHFYEVSIEAAFYHRVKYYLRTDNLKSLDQLNLQLSPIGFAHQYTLSPATTPFENEMNLYLPKDGCMTYIRLDMVGINPFFTHISYAAYDQRDGSSLVMPEMIESFDTDPGHIIYPISTKLSNEAENICEKLNQQHQEDLAFDIEVYVMSDIDEEFEFFAFTWDSTSGQWRQEE